MISIEHVREVMARRNCFHVNDQFHIVYCVFDDRKNCRHKFHAETPAAVYSAVMDSDDTEFKNEFLKRSAARVRASEESQWLTERGF